MNLAKSACAHFNRIAAWEEMADVPARGQADPWNCSRFLAAARNHRLMCFSGFSSNFALHPLAQKYIVCPLYSLVAAAFSESIVILHTGSTTLITSPRGLDSLDGGRGLAELQVDFADAALDLHFYRDG